MLKPKADETKNKAEEYGICQEDQVQPSGVEGCTLFLTAGTKGGDAGEIMGRKKKVCPERIVEELAAIGFARVTDVLCIEDGELVVRPTDALSSQSQAAIASVERMSSGCLKIKLYDKMKALELLGKHLGMFEGKTEEENNREENILKVTDYSAVFDDILLENVSFELKAGEKIAIVGENGTGKTTLLRDIFANCNKFCSPPDN